MSQKGPSAYFKCLKTKPICSCLFEMHFESIGGAVGVGKDLWSPNKAGLITKDLICFWHSREYSLQGWCILVTSDCSQAAREIQPL